MNVQRNGALLSMEISGISKHISSIDIVQAEGTTMSSKVEVLPLDNCGNNIAIRVL